MQLITPEYRDLNTALHRFRPDYGTSGLKYFDLICSLLGEKCQNVLDYGCGKGLLAKALIPIISDVREYDPSIAGKDGMPEPAELVVCTDVLEHVEPECISDVLDHLTELTQRVCFMSIALVPAKKFLADGRNAHILLRPPRWWIEEIHARMDFLRFSVFNNEMTLICAPRT